MGQDTCPTASIMNVFFFVGAVCRASALFPSRDLLILGYLSFICVMCIASAFLGLKSDGMGALALDASIYYEAEAITSRAVGLVLRNRYGESIHHLPLASSADT